MEKVEIGTSNFTQVLVLDEPGQGNACHEYRVDTIATKHEPITIVGQVSFQNGPVKEAGINGLHQEDLLAIVIHRLQGFQSGAFACRENALALTKLEEAMHWLRHRTDARKSRGVEGRNIK